MYGNSPFGTEEADSESLSPEQRRRIERDLSRVAERTIPDNERDDIARGLAASAALQVKQALGENSRPTAR